MEKETCCCRKTGERSKQRCKSPTNRLNRIEGQVWGIKSMVGEDAYYTDILVRVAVINAALSSFSKEPLISRVRDHVVNDIRDNKEEAIDKPVATIRKLTR